MVKTDSVMQNLLWMLEVADHHDFAETATAHLEEAPTSFFDLFAYLLGKNLLPELERGVAHAYEAFSGDLRAVRGRIGLVEQVTRNWNRFDRVFCTWDEFTSDTAVNRLFKCACRFLSERVNYQEASRLLLECQERLSEVQDVSAVTALRGVLNLRLDSSLRFTDFEGELNGLDASALAGRILSPDDVRQLTVYAELVRLRDRLVTPPVHSRLGVFGDRSVYLQAGRLNGSHRNISDVLLVRYEWNRLCSGFKLGRNSYGQQSHSARVRFAGHWPKKTRLIQLAPPEHLVGVHTMRTRDRRNRNSRHQCLFDDPPSLGGGSVLALCLWLRNRISNSFHTLLFVNTASSRATREECRSGSAASTRPSRHAYRYSARK